MNKDRLIKNLLNFDREVGLLYPDSDECIKCYIVGGGAFVLTDRINRMTSDVDVLGAVPDDILKLMQKYNINTNVNAYLCFFAYDFLARAEKLDVGSKYVDFYVLSLEDLVASKLASGRDKDLEDIKKFETVSNINWSLLDKIIETIIEGMLSDWDIQALKTNYKNYKEEYKNEKTDI